MRLRPDFTASLGLQSGVVDLKPITLARSVVRRKFQAVRRLLAEDQGTIRRWILRIADPRSPLDELPAAPVVVVHEPVKAHDGAGLQLSRRYPLDGEGDLIDPAAARLNDLKLSLNRVISDSLWD